MIPSLSRNRAQQLAPPAIDWRWVVNLPSIPGAPNSKNIVVEAIEFPHFSISAIPRFNGASNRHYPGISEISAFAMTFYEDNMFSATKYLYAWKSLVVDTNGIYGVPADYKKDLRLRMYDIQDHIMFNGTLQECWPTNISSYSLNYNDSNRLTISAQFATDGSTVV